MCSAGDKKLGKEKGLMGEACLGVETHAGVWLEVWVGRGCSPEAQDCGEAGMQIGTNQVPRQRPGIIGKGRQVEMMQSEGRGWVEESGGIVEWQQDQKSVRAKALVRGGQETPQGERLV